MLDAMPLQNEEKSCLQGSSLKGFKQGEYHGEGEEERGSQKAALHARAGDALKCIMWCAIALGALVQGCALDFVSFASRDANVLDTAVHFTYFALAL